MLMTRSPKVGHPPRSHYTAYTLVEYHCSFFLQRLSLPPRDPFYIPNTPRVPFTARGVLNQTLSQRHHPTTCALSQSLPHVRISCTLPLSPSLPPQSTSPLYCQCLHPIPGRCRRPSLANGPGSNSSGAQTTRDVSHNMHVPRQLEM